MEVSRQSFYPLPAFLVGSTIQGRRRNSRATTRKVVVIVPIAETAYPLRNIPWGFMTRHGTHCLILVIPLCLVPMMNRVRVTTLVVVNRNIFPMLERRLPVLAVQQRIRHFILRVVVPKDMLDKGLEEYYCVGPISQYSKEIRWILHYTVGAYIV